MERLRDIREDRDLKQKDIAQILNMSQTGYSKYEVGTNDIPTEVLKKLAHYYNTSIDYLLYETDERKPYSKSLKEKNKINSAICLANMYSLIPKYTNEISSDTTKSKLENVKSNIIFAYSIVETDRWDDVLKLLGQAETDLTELMTMKENLSTMRKPKINKAYVLLKELIKSSNDKNVDIFYLKYINLIEELDNL